MGRIVPLFRERRHEVQDLLAWYVTGRLEPAERARVEAHVAACVQCEAELRSEQRLARALTDEVSAADLGWDRLKSRLGRQGPDRVRAGERFAAAPAGPGGWRGAWRPGGAAPALAWGVAAAVLLTVALAPALRSTIAPSYHALGANLRPAQGNIVALFRPQTPEGRLRRDLNAAGVRLVGGPTPADAWILAAPASRRAAALAALRAQGDVTAAEAIDAGPSP